MYGAAPHITDALTALAKETKARGWWHSYGDAVPDWFQPYVGMESAASRIRQYQCEVVPGLLQTAEYARARFAEGLRLLKVPNDIDGAVQGRIQRQEILYQLDKRFHFLLTEAALRLRLCPPDVMLGQLDRLISFSALPNVRLGVIGFETRYATAPWHGFWIYDEDRVLVETYSAALNLAQPPEVDLYAAVFDELASIASYGRAARAIIMTVIDDIAPEASEDGD